MAHRIRISEQTELSAAAGAIIQTDAALEQSYLALGTANQILAVNAGATALEYVTANAGVSNLALGTVTATTQPITNSNGTGFTLPSATATDAGLMPAASLVDITDLTTLTGVASNAADFGTFTGTTLTDNLALKPLLQEIETALEAIPDAETYFVADITARDAITPTDTADMAYVTDASADGTVTSGGAQYIWSGAAWVKVAEFESMDLTNSFTLAADTGTAEVVDGGETVTITGGSGVATSVAATNTVTVAIQEQVDVFSPADAATTVTASQTPTSTVKVFRNGLKQKLTEDYTVAGTTVTLIPAIGGSTGGSTGFEDIELVYFY